MSTPIIIGLAIAGSAICVKAAYQGWKNMAHISKLTGSSAFTHYYKGGFDQKMGRREAILILGVREFDSPDRIKDAYRRVLMANHPDRGGSPYVASKINEARGILDNKR